MVNKATDDRVSLQGWGRQRVVKHLWGRGLLHEQLAALAGPLATNLTLNEKLGGNNVQPLADVFTHAHHGLTALWRWAVGVLRLDVLINAGQMGGQRFAFGTTAWRLVGRWGAWSAVLQGSKLGSKLGFQVGLVGSKSLFKQAALLRVHALGFGTKFPGLELGQLEGDALDLRVTPLDGLGLRVDLFGLLCDVLGLLCELFGLLADVQQHLRRQVGQLV